MFFQTIWLSWCISPTLSLYFSRATLSSRLQLAYITSALSTGLLKNSRYLDGIYLGVHRTKIALNFIEFLIRALHLKLTLVGTQSSFNFADINASMSSNLLSASIYKTLAQAKRKGRDAPSTSTRRKTD